MGEKKISPDFGGSAVGFLMVADPLRAWQRERPGDSINANKQRGSRSLSGRCASNTSHTSRYTYLSLSIFGSHTGSRSTRFARGRERKTRKNMGYERHAEGRMEPPRKTRDPCRRSKQTAKAADVLASQDIFSISRRTCAAFERPCENLPELTMYICYGRGPTGLKCLFRRTTRRECEATKKWTGKRGRKW